MKWYHAHMPLQDVNSLSSERTCSNTSKTRIYTLALSCQAISPCPIIFKVCYTWACPTFPTSSVPGSTTRPLAIPTHHGSSADRYFPRRLKWTRHGSVTLCTLILEGTRCVSNCWLMGTDMVKALMWLCMSFWCEETMMTIWSGLSTATSKWH